MKSKVVTVSPTVRKLKYITDTVYEDRLTVYAAQTAFYICISAIPFVMLLIMLSRIVMPSLSFEIAPTLHQLLPHGASEIVDYIFTEASRSADIPLLSTAAVTALWSASRGMRGIMRGVSEVYDVSMKGTFVYTVIRSVVYTAVFIVILLFTVLFFVTGGLYASRLAPVGESRGRHLGILLFLLFLCLYFSLLYYVVARGGIFYRRGKSVSKDCPEKYASQLPGALFAAGGWILFSYFYSLYIRFFPRSSYVYGSLGAVVFLMLWLYFCIFIILLGAEINKVLYMRKKNVTGKG